MENRSVIKSVSYFIGLIVLLPWIQSCSGLISNDEASVDSFLDRNISSFTTNSRRSGYSNRRTEQSHTSDSDTKYNEYSDYNDSDDRIKNSDSYDEAEDPSGDESMTDPTSHDEVRSWQWRT